MNFRVVFLLVFALALRSDVSGLDREYQIKAEFLERFTRFIEWPANPNGPETSGTFSFCVIGKNPYGSYLHDLAAATKVQKKKIVIKEISSPEAAVSCNLLFISRSEQESLALILSHTNEKPILTVSDSAGFGARGVLINFYEDQGFVRFEINPQAVERSRLKFSSRLLKLGRLITNEEAAQALK